MCELLLSKGAILHGLALAPTEKLSLFDQLKLADRLDHAIVDLCDETAVTERVNSCKPSVVFHLAAQSLVKKSYKDPVATWMVNVMGSMHLMSAVSQLKRPVSVVMVTTDKVYENLESHHSYCETDRLGGWDPYAASKAAVEIAVSSWRRSFSGINIATVRAGNVIGGGDWAENRIVPDLARSFAKKEVLLVRNPESTRPFQHVLDPLAGYLLLGEKLSTGDRSWQCAFNFGPNLAEVCSVKNLVETAIKIWPGKWSEVLTLDVYQESDHLSLDSRKANQELGWYPHWNMHRSIAETVRWYKEFSEGADPSDLIQSQLYSHTTKS
jgi:CDP-glucose 4,6-dehydratase